MTTSSAPKRERRQSRTKNRAGRSLFRRPWFLKLLVAMAPLVTKLVELVITLIKQQK
jgi:hypothetical protein